MAFYLDLREAGSLDFLCRVGENIYCTFLAHIMYSSKGIESMGFWAKYVMMDF